MASIPQSPENVLQNIGTGTASAAVGLLNAINYPQQMMFKSMLGATKYNRLVDDKGYANFRDVLRDSHIVGSENTWGNALATAPLDFIVDPVNATGIGLLGKGVGALSRAGRVASKAGLTGHTLGRTLTKAAQLGADINPKLVDQASEGAAKIGKPLSKMADADIFGRTPLRPRQTARTATLKDVLKSADAGVDVRNVDMIRKAVDDNPRLLDQTLNRDFSFGTPNYNFGFNVPGGERLARGADSLIEGAKFSYPGRAVQSVFNKNLDNVPTTNAETQRLVSGTRMMQDQAGEVAAQRAGLKAASLYGDNAAQQIFSPEGNRVLADAIEKPVAPLESVANPLTENKAVQDYADWWSKESVNELTESKKLGLQAETLDDPNLEGYLPRTLSPLIEEYSKAGSSGGKALSTMTGDMFARAEALKMPGGRNRITFDLASDNRLVGPKRLLKNDEEAADLIGEKVYGNAKAQRRKTRELASLLHRLPDESLSQQPLFGQHPTESITKYMTNRAKARAGAQSQIDILGTRAAQGTQDGAPTISASSALKTLGLQTERGYGAGDMLRNVIARQAGARADDIRLSEWFVPESILGALTTGKEVKTAGELGQIASWWQSTWRNAILNWPSRYVRDLMGGMYSNHMEGALTVRGLDLATKIMRDGAHAHGTDIAAMPFYKGKSSLEAASTFYADLMSTDLISTGSRLDKGLAGQAVSDMFPGSTAPGSGPLSQMASEYGKSLSNISGIFDPNSQFAISGAKVGDISDQFNRLSGYSELMYQGYAPQEAAARMKRTHVDYSSLSETEQRVRSTAVPFYTFMTRMLGEQARRILEEPGKMSRTLKAVTYPQRSEEDRAIMPDYVNEKFGFNIGTDKATGNKSYLYNIDMPGLEQIPLLMDLAEGNVGAVTDQAAGMLNPVLKMGAENLTGSQAGFMKGQPLEQRRGNLSRILQEEYPSRPVQYLDRALEMLPGASRVTNTAAKLVRNAGEVPIGQRLLDAAVSETTGLKRQTYTIDDQLWAAQNAQLNRVKNSGAPMTNFNITAVPKAMEPLLTPTQARENDKLKDIKRTMTFRRKQEKSSLNLNEQ